MVRIGLVALADQSGVAVQTQDFARHMKPASVLVVDTRHWGRTVDASVIEAPKVRLWRTPHPNTMPMMDKIIPEFLDEVDVVFTVESAYNTRLFAEAEDRGIPTVLQFNYEFLDHMREPLPHPTIFAAPTSWHIEDVEARFPGRVRDLPVPVDRDRFRFKLRTNAETILHTMGMGTGEDRNGTEILLEAMTLVKTPVHLHLKGHQKPPRSCGPNVTVDISMTENPQDLYGDEGMFVMPRRFGGLCLGMREALSVGMPVIGTDRSPERGFLNDDLLVEAERYGTLQTRSVIGLWRSSPLALAQMLDHYYEHPEEVEILSRDANERAEAISWEKLKPVYDKLLEGSPL